MKKEKGYILKRIADEYNIFPCGEKAEETQEVLTLSESAAWIYNNSSIGSRDSGRQIGTWNKFVFR